jgi:NitT/TauT family transport system substrate-binding protein
MRLSSARIGVSALGTSRRWLRPLAVLLAAMTAVAGLAACNPLSNSQAADGPADTPVVKVGVVPGIENATLYLAKKRGFFARAGLHVRIVDFASVAAELNALRIGQVDVAAGDYGDLFAAQSALQKSAYKILADGYDAAPGVVQIMTMPNSPITSPTSLRVVGAPDLDQVQAPRGSPSSLVVASATSVLQSYGVNLSNLTWKPMSESDEISQLISGKLKAVLLTQPYVYEAQQQGAVELVDACSGATAGIPLSGYFTSTSWSQNKTKEIAAFRTALAQADAQAAMPGPVQSVLPEYAKLTKREAALVTTGVYPLSTITASLQRTADLMNFVGMIKKQLNVAEMIAK